MFIIFSFPQIIPISYISSLFNSKLLPFSIIVVVVVIIIIIIIYNNNNNNTSSSSLFFKVDQRNS